MKKVYYIILFFVFSYTSFSFNQLLISDTVNIGEVIVGQTKSISIFAKNTSNRTINIKKIISYDDYNYYKITSNPIVLNPNDSISIANIEVKPTQNIDTYFHLFVNYSFNDNSNLFVPIVIKTKAILENQYYSSTQNKWGNELFLTLKSLIQPHTSFSYKEARKILWTGADRINGIVECIYTGKTKEVSDDPDFAIIDGEGFNTEHVWPRAFGADNEPQLSDMFHIYPTDKLSNTKRDNYPFDNVVSNIAYQDGGSKLGKNANGDIAFEVRDVSKGNIARSMFYFATKYGNIKNYLQKQENTLHQWHQNDLPDAKELARNDSIYKYQKNRNPYIDFPEFIERLQSISTEGGTIPTSSKLKSISNIYELEGEVKNINKFIDIFIHNQGNKTNKILSYKTETQSQYFNVEDNSSFDYSPNSFHYLRVLNNNPSLQVNDTLNIQFFYEDGTKENTLVIFRTIFNSITHNNEDLIKISNNPSDTKQIIKLSNSLINMNSNIELYSVYGEKMYDFKQDINRIINTNLINFEDYSIDLSIGTYILKITSKEKVLSKKILIVK